MRITLVVLLNSFLPVGIVMIQLSKILSPRAWKNRLLRRFRVSKIAGPAKLIGPEWAVSFSALRPKVWKSFMPHLPTSERIILLRATENDLFKFAICILKRHWLRRVPQLEVRNISCSHNSMLDEEHIPKIARTLSESCSREQKS